MKSPILLVVFLLSSLSDSFSQCNAFFPIRENVKVYYDHFDKNDKLTLRTTQKLINVTGSGNKMKATMVQELIDVKKNEPMGSSESEWSCDGGTLQFHVNNMSMGPAMSANGMTMEVTGDKMDIPSSLQVGQKLKDLNYQIKMNMNGVTLMNQTFKVTERTVEKEENVTTAAGTFSAFKVSFITASQGGVGGGTMKSTMWFGKDVGLVKTESFSLDGKLLARQVLSKIEK